MTNEVPRTRRFAAIAVAAVLASLVVAVGPGTGQAVQSPHAGLVAGKPVAWSPWVDDGAVRAITQVGSKIIVGGTFASVRPPGATTGVPRSHIFAFDATTGAIDPTFRVALNGPVHALAPSPDGQGVIVGGAFTTVNGSRRSKLVTLSLAGSVVPTFAGSATGGNVLDLTVRGGTLYVGGKFTSVNGVPRTYLAALDASTGALRSDLNLTIAGTFNGGTTHVRALDVTPDGARMVIVGNFGTVNGLDRVQVAQVDLTTSPATVANWATDRFKPRCLDRFEYIVNDVDYAPDGSYFAIVTTGAFMGGVDAGVLCDTATRWETYASGTRIEPTWVDYAGGDTQVGVAVTGAAVYTSGHMRWQNSPYAGDTAGPGAVARQGLSALDPVNGLPFRWNPRRQISNGSWDTTLFATPAGLWVGFDRETVAGETHRRLAFFPLAGGSPVPTPTSGSLPGRLYSLPSSGTSDALTWRDFDGTTAGPATLQPTSIDWSAARGAFMLDGVLYHGKTDGNLYSRTFDGTGFGPERLHFPYVIGPGAVFANATGIFYWNGRIYYTIAGDSRMRYRYFTPESGVVGAVAFTVPSNGFNWSTATGVTMADGQLFWASAGNLLRASFTNGAPTGLTTVVSGPLIDGQRWEGRGMFLVAGPTPDTQPPSTPANLRTSAVSADRVELAWDASTDDVGVASYVVSRDGAVVATVPASTTTYTDHDVAPATSYAYQVSARDDAGNASAPTAPVDVTTPPAPSALFADGFESGDLSAWTSSVGMTVQSTDVASGTWAATGLANGSRAFAAKTLGTDVTTISVSVLFKIVTQGTNGINVLRVTDAPGTSNIVTAFVSQSGTLMLRNDRQAANISSSVAVSRNAWHELQLDVTVAGTASTVAVTFDGASVPALTRTVDLGTTPIGRLIVGDSVTGRTSEMRYDDVVAT